MEKNSLESLEKSFQDNLFIVEKLKREYRKITPLEAFAYLGESKPISRILKSKLGKLQILDVIVAKQNYGDSKDYYCLCSNGFRSETDDLINDLFSKEWFVKL